tara:strand:+ start:2213 stop:3661 length:1449 start_codon:yes stop_codon:yes gene_type:complete
MFALSEKEQNFKPSRYNKLTYGEVNTPYELINEMLDLLEKDDPFVFKKPYYKWLDPACGYGYYMFALFNRLYNGLKNCIPDDNLREKHIIQNMLFMYEINGEHIQHIKSKFKYEPNITNDDFLSPSNKLPIHNFDYIIGNPPYNSHGIKKVPTLKDVCKKQDGKTVWDKFVKRSLFLLNNNKDRNSGGICFIIPSIWMKPDKSDNYSVFFGENMRYIKTFDNTRTKKIFKGQAQTPTCFFLLKKINYYKELEDQSFYLFDSLYNDYIEYKHNIPNPVPLDFPYIFNVFNSLKCKPLKSIIYKTNMPNKNTTLSDTIDKTHIHKNIHTCRLNDDNTPILIIKYSNFACKYASEQKIVLANKMYGFPYYDKTGEFGISNRDSYVIPLNNTDYTNHEIQILIDYLNSPFIILLFEATRYRMKYLEKYVFELIPNIIELERKYRIFKNDTFNQTKFIDFLNFNSKYKESLLSVLSTKKKYNPCILL